MAFLARSKSVPQPSLEPISDGAKESLRNVEKALGAEPSGSEPKRGKKRKRSGRKKRSRADSAESESKESKKAKKELRDKRNSREHPKKWGGLFHSTQDGKPICYAFAKGDTPESCPGQCKNNRAHRCQHCLPRGPFDHKKLGHPANDHKKKPRWTNHIFMATCGATASAGGFHAWLVLWGSSGL